MPIEPEALLEGPRGRFLCLAVATGLDSEVGYAWSQSAARRSDPLLRRTLIDALRRLDVEPVRAERDALAFADAVRESVSKAMGWQPPHEEDLLTADPAVVAALRPVAAAITAAPGIGWWDSPVDLATQRCTDRYTEYFPAEPPALEGVPAALRAWHGRAVTEEESARRERPEDPSASWSGTWWSMPGHPGVPHTTRGTPFLGSLTLLWEEDTLGKRQATVQPVRTRRTPRVYEIDGPAAWIELVRRFPLDVTASRRHDWYRVTGRAAAWAIPDWLAVAEDFDGVHLTVLGYLRTATRLLEIDETRSTLLAGWDPDATWWLADVLTMHGLPPEHWTDPAEEPSGWRRVDRT